MSDIDTTKIGAALELIIDAASQHAVDRVSAGRLALYGELRAALTAAEARGRSGSGRGASTRLRVRGLHCLTPPPPIRPTFKWRTSRALGGCGKASCD
jgi:hypothetical protein